MDSEKCYLFYTADDENGIMKCISEMHEIPEHIVLSYKRVLLDKIDNFYTIYDYIHYDNRNKIIELDKNKKYYVLSMRQQQMSSNFMYLFDSADEVVDFMYVLYDGSKSKIVSFEKEWKEYTNGLKEWLYHKIEDEDINIANEITMLEQRDWMVMEKVDEDDENHEFYWRIHIKRVN